MTRRDAQREGPPERVGTDRRLTSFVVSIKTMRLPENTHRRTVLKTLGVAAVGGTASAGTAAARGNLVSKINSHGHYAWFPLGPDSWARSKNPFDTRRDEFRWMARPGAGGSVRCLVRNLPASRNAGFDVHVGRLGDIREVTIDAETVRTTRPGGTAELFVGLYLDADDDGDFFAWNDGRGNTDTWAGFGKDSEGATFPTADGEITLDGSTEFQLFHVGGGPNPATLRQLQDGEVSGVEGETINGNTDAAVYVGVASAGEGTEEVIVDSLTVERA
jgi:hypothetical protein